MNKDEGEQKTFAQKEEEVLKFWQENKIFEKSLKANEGKDTFVFYDGPPFATGLPHYGHLLAGMIKDVIPRFQTMHGKYVRRVWGWDCHGLPIENLIEKDLGLNSKKEIEELGIDKFNDEARKNVLRYEDEWKKIVPRMGRWIDMEHPYMTMDSSYTESVWWAFSELYKKGLIYKDYKSMHICPRCETTLANSEVTLNYADVKDISVTVKFELIGQPGVERGEHDMYLLAWTTTPWTLPGNVALAMNPEMDYAICQVGHERLVVAKDALERGVLGDMPYEIKEVMKGTGLIGKSYKPLFDYYEKDENLPNRENGWKIYAADFVENETGTGIVHIAPAFGEDDLELGRKMNLPFVQHVSMDGRFKPEVTDFAGMKVKQKDDTQSADIEIIKKLAHDGVLFSKEKITHSYPLCWRCDTPLLNYATDSWFVRVTAIKDTLLGANKTTGWVPETMKDGRFGKWLEGARDWAISRSRYWGAPIPVWQCEQCEEVAVAGSLGELKERTPKSGNSYFVMRHGGAESNKNDVVSSSLEAPNHLTPEGGEGVRRTGEQLKDKKIDLIYASDLFRTKETAELVAETIGYPKENILYDVRLRELGFGDMDGKPRSVYHAFFNNLAERFTKKPEGGENFEELKKRVSEFLFELDTNNQGKNILIVTHQDPAWMLFSGAEGLPQKDILKQYEDIGPAILKNAECRSLAFTPFPHNENYELDFHRPYIDEVKLLCSCGGEMQRVKELFDCWFESGSMPYAQFHYPFENKEKFHKNFPANFIAEGVDQTRGWFYNMMVLSVALFGESPFQNVVVNGIVLAEDGQKMAKRLKNYPDPMEVGRKYGTDTLRFYLLSSPVVRGEELMFSEKGVDEVSKKITRRFENVLRFFELYKYSVHPGGEHAPSNNGLDIWIIERLRELSSQLEEEVEQYRLDRGYRLIAEFIDDLSTWYVRRSRDRFKVVASEDARFAFQTLHHTLLQFSKILAPFMPFFADETYRRLDGDLESVHLEAWPNSTDILRKSAPEHSILGAMKRVREVVSLAHEARAKEGIKVRQPLRELRVKKEVLEGGIDENEGLLQLIADEVNVKTVTFRTDFTQAIELDTTMTDELKEEGEYRELLRCIQSMRKNSGFNRGEKGVLTLDTKIQGKPNVLRREFIERCEEKLKTEANLSKVAFKEGLEGENVKMGDKEFTISLSR